MEGRSDKRWSIKIWAYYSGFHLRGDIGRIPPTLPPCKSDLLGADIIGSSSESVNDTLFDHTESTREMLLEPSEIYSRLLEVRL